ncbi:hypothetical protein C8R44DRAFT_987644 [Mycena epipterygia]|nr:hypothetical protein C8R44DRAFT_987644 [Mycena epipterygia]
MRCGACLCSEPTSLILYFIFQWDGRAQRSFPVTLPCSLGDMRTSSPHQERASADTWIHTSLQQIFSCFIQSLAALSVLGVLC